MNHLSKEKFEEIVQEGIKAIPEKFLKNRKCLNYN